MTSKRYLQRLGNRWYVRVKVPRSLQGRLRNTHIRRALGTGDLAEANRLKWAALARIQSELERLRQHHDGLSAGVPEAPQWSLKVDREGTAIRLPERLTRPLEAPGDTLDALVDRWLEDADYTAQTKQQHRQAYFELKAFLGGDRSPAVVTPDLALDYVEQHLMRSGWAYATKRRKLNALVALWEWLALRRQVPRNANPWRGFKLGTKRTASTPTRIKRPYTNDELIQLFSRRPVYAGLADVMVLGLLTGMRLDEICALRMADLDALKEGGFTIHIRKSKTKAGIRSIVLVHPLGNEVLQRRWIPQEGESAQVFPEFRPGGYDGKLSWAVSKAFGRHRTQMGLSGETDFHSFRRSFITLLENCSVDQVRIARYVGHELPTLAFAVYSGGSSVQTMRATAEAIRYPGDVEAALTRFLRVASDH